MNVGAEANWGPSPKKEREGHELCRQSSNRARARVWLGLGKGSFSSSHKNLENSDLKTMQYGVQLK